MVRLLACPGCERHVRSTESECPFCGQALEGLAPRALAPVPSRAAAVFIGAAALVGCGKEPAPPGPKPDNEHMAVPAYGVPPQDLQPPPTATTPPPDAAPPDAAAPKKKP
jgi:hypothetical protein